MKFTAIEIESGDSFIIHSGEYKILVDGGVDKNYVGKYINAGGPNQLDLMVCTHGDLDHVFGLIKLLEDEYLLIQIKEVWLHSKWCERLSDLSSKTFQDLVDKIKHIALDKVVEDPEIKPEKISEFLNNEEQMADKLHLLDTVLQYYEIWTLLPKGIINFTIDVSGMSEVQIDIFLKEIIAHTMIIKLANLATIRGAKVKFLRFINDGELPSISENSLPLTPLCHTDLLDIYINCGGIYEIKPYKIPPLKEINKQSIVLSSVQEPHVLLCSDSDLNKCDLSRYGKNNTILITSPHHGAISNFSAFNNITEELITNKLVWVRGDNHTILLYPGYSALPGIKYCVRCRDWQNQKTKTNSDQRVELEFIQDSWVKKSGNSCICVPLKRN